MKEYKYKDDVLVLLQDFQDIDNFLLKSIEFFLRESDRHEIITKCRDGEKLYEQIVNLTKSPENLEIKANLRNTYTRVTLRSIYNTIKEIGSNYICDIIHYVMNVLPYTVSPEESKQIAHILLERYKAFLTVHNAFQQVYCFYNSL